MTTKSIQRTWSSQVQMGRELTKRARHGLAHGADARWVARSSGEVSGEEAVGQVEERRDAEDAEHVRDLDKDGQIIERVA